MIKHVVQEEVNRKTAEERDMENRKRNIVIYGVPEKKRDKTMCQIGKLVMENLLGICWMQFLTLSLMIAILIRCID